MVIMGWGSRSGEENGKVFEVMFLMSDLACFDSLYTLKCDSRLESVTSLTCELLRCCCVG